tara:strand:+ start:752 stop:1804 length:1053 start_codon:yes stop_codon:yes gene_type:complete
MPDYIDTMMYVGEIPWHKQGTMVHEAPSIKDAIELAGLEWEVRKAPTYFEVNKEDSRYYQNLGEKFWNLGSVKKSYHKETGHYVTYRTDTGEPLGNVSSRYEILQNRDAFEPFEPMLDMGFTLETAGAVQNGKKIWVLAKAPEKYHVGDDRINRYVFMFTSHDGSTGNCFRDTMIRIVCYNTLDYALSKKGTFEYSLKHTSSIKQRVMNLKETIAESEGNFAKAIESMNRFQDIELNDHTLDLYLETVIPFLKNRNKESIPEKGIFFRNTAKPVYDRLIHLYRKGQGNKGKTLWDAYNAVTEYYTHDKQYKDWVQATQFGKPYDYKVTAYKVAEQYSNSYHTEAGPVYYS